MYVRHRGIGIGFNSHVPQRIAERGSTLTDVLDRVVEAHRRPEASTGLPLALTKGPVVPIVTFRKGMRAVVATVLEIGQKPNPWTLLVAV